jgi:hypothetical protein
LFNAADDKNLRRGKNFKNLEDHKAQKISTKNRKNHYEQPS